MLGRKPEECGMWNLEFGLRSWLFPKGEKQLVAQRAIIELFNVEFI